MNKKILAIGIGAALGMVPMFANAEATVYGNFAASVDSVDGGAVDPAIEAVANTQYTIGLANAYNRWFQQAIAIPAVNASESRQRVTSTNSYIGVKGSEKISDGLSAVYQYELAVAIDRQTINNEAATDTTNTQSKRNTFVGLASGAAGTLTFGLQDTPVKVSTGRYDVFKDTVADYRNIIGAYGGSLRAENSLQWASPNWAGVQIKALYAPQNEGGNGAATDPKNLTSFSVGWEGAGFSVVAATESGGVVGRIGDVNAGGTAQPVQTPAVLYGPNTGMAMYWIFPTVSTAAAGATVGYTDYTAEMKTTRLGLGYGIGGFKVGAVYEKSESSASATYTGGTAVVALPGTGTGTANADRTAYMVSASYNFGNTTVMGAYTKANDIGGTSGWTDSGATQMTLGVGYALSKNTSVYGLYSSLSNGANAMYGIAGGATGIAGVSAANMGNDVSAISLGMKSSF